MPSPSAIPCAAEWPCPRILAEPRLDRIAFDVADKPFVILPAADDVVEKLGLPHLPAAISGPVDETRRERLPRLDDLRQGLCPRRHDDVHVVRHHHPGVQGEPVFVEVDERALDDPGEVRSAEERISRW